VLEGLYVEFSLHLINGSLLCGARCHSIDARSSRQVLVHAQNVGKRRSVQKRGLTPILGPRSSNPGNDSSTDLIRPSEKPYRYRIPKNSRRKTMRTFYFILTVSLVVFGLQASGLSAGFISTAHAQCSKVIGNLSVTSDKPLSTAWYCHQGKYGARASAKGKWRDAAESRWGGRYASWKQAIKKKVQCRKTHKATNGVDSCGYGTRGKWQCRAMACAMELR